MNRNAETPGLPAIGANLHRERKRQQLSLDELSETSQVSKAMLSQIETGKVNPTVAVLWKIIQALGIDFEVLLQSGSEDKRRFEVNRGHQITSLITQSSGTLFRVISPVSMANELEFYHVTQEPGCTHHSAGHLPGTEELIAVLKGRITVKAGNNEAELQKGDFLAFEADLPHSISTTSTGKSEFQMVVRFPL
ncbi:MAG: XRE family transcriptional regulator [Lentisphaeria bacterium]|jgi:transcriptional regulator with XRE-family HTH domain|nr:XRE family transcriptional regulator [Lentisphaeria bacterium]